ncbi:MAG: DUF4924 family protein [Bacteroidota bacterium]
MLVTGLGLRTKGIKDADYLNRRNSTTHVIPAERKKQDNIAEYLIHMYQTEDLIRAFEFDLNKITEYVIKHVPQEVERKELILFYAEIIIKMRDENIQQTGHLQSTQKIVSELLTLKNELQTTDQKFIKIWRASEGIIHKYAEQSGANEIQVCLNGIYGLLLLRLNGNPVSEEIKQHAELYGDILSYLSYKYKQKHFTNPN